MAEEDKKIVSISSRLAKFIGSKATRETKLQAAAMQAEFTLRDTLVILCYLSKDPDPEIHSQARKNLIPAARSWYTRPDRPQLPEPIYEIVMKVIEKVGLGEKLKSTGDDELVRGNIGLLGLGEMIQAIDHNNRTVTIILNKDNDVAKVYTQNGKVVGAVTGEDDGLPALYAAFSWADAAFEYFHAPPGQFTNRINANTLNLVMDALEYAPEEDPFYSDVSKNWEVRGHLRVLNIFEIAEIFEMNSKQTVCHLKRGDQEEGKLFFKNGRIVNATYGGLTGMDAACHLLAWPNAEFHIVRGEENVSEVIHVGMQNLIIEAMRLFDEGVTVTEQIANEIAMINELFEGQDIVTLPVLEKVRLVFSEDQKARETLENDTNPLVRKAIKVKISKTVHNYLSAAADYETKLKAARGNVPVSTTEKLVLLTYLSHDESQEIRDQAKKTLAELDVPTYRKGFGADLHPAVIDFLVRETVKDESLIRMVAACPTLMEETALYIMENWKGEDLYKAFLDNRKLLERSPLLAQSLASNLSEYPSLKARVDYFEESMLQGQGEIKIEGFLSFFGLAGLIRAARHGMRSGTIVLETTDKSGRVFFEKGRIIGAIWDRMEGIPALEAILEAESVRFRYLLRTYFHKKNLDPSAAEEILERPTAGPSLHQSHKGLSLVTGSLSAMDLFELLSSLEGTPMPVAISVICEEGTGEVYRDRSRILHAYVAGKEGPLQAMAAMLSWNGLRFILRYATTDFPITVDKSLSDFFTESVKLVPEEITRVTRPGELPEWELSEEEYESLYHQILNMGVADKIKLAFFGNKEARDILVRDANKLVAVAVVKSPKIQESEIETISKSRQVCEDVLRQIASTKEWMKSYTVKLNLVSNSKTPIPIAIKLLSQIREPDLRKLAKSKNVSSQVATLARRLVDAKGIK